ncbi:unnamed protein product [Effrenium voratum]|nr:unnamed protein product [Effrenium voratum]CAJ1418810.1 unnamed protein product [Effrenium voratum]
MSIHAASLCIALSWPTSQAQADLCSLPRIDGRGLGQREFRRLRGRPFLLHSLDLAPKLFVDRKELDAFGNSRVQLEAGIDESSTHFRLTKEWRILRDYIRR